jgi:hypothetical protein
MNSTYTLEVYNKEHKPLFVVTINSPILVGVYFFNTLKESNTYINQEKVNLYNYGCDLKYNCDGVSDKRFKAVIKNVIENDDIAIGKDGRTYSKNMFPNGI